MYDRISRLFSALMPSPSSSSNNNNNNNRSTMSHSNIQHSPNSNTHNNDNDDDEMSADLLSQETPPPPAASASAMKERSLISARGNANTITAVVVPPRPSLRSDVCVWNSTRKQNVEMNNKNDDNNGGAHQDDDEEERPSLDSDVGGTCHNANKDDVPAASSPEKKCNNKVEEPWRNYGKSYARHGARNPANYGTNSNNAPAVAKNDEDVTTNNDEDGATCDNDTNKKKTSPPPYSLEKKKKTHQLTRRLQQHATTTTTRTRRQQRQHSSSSSSSSHSSSTKNGDHITTNNEQTNPPSKRSSTYNNHHHPPITLLYTSSPKPTNTSSPIGQEIEIANNNQSSSIHDTTTKEEHYDGTGEEFSPLTCPPSQSYLYGGGSCCWHAENNNNDDDEEEENGNENDANNEGNVEDNPPADGTKEEDANSCNDEEEKGSSSSSSRSRKLQNDPDYERRSSKGASSSSSSSDYHHPTLVKHYTAALKKASNTTNNNHIIASTNEATITTTTITRGIKRKKTTALDLALMEESTKNNIAAAAASNIPMGSGRNYNRRKKKFNKNAIIAAALAEKEDSQTPPYDVPTPRNAEEEEEEEGVDNNKKKEEEWRGSDTNEVNFFPCHDEEEEEKESSGTERQSEALLSSPSIQPQAKVVVVAAATTTTTAVAATTNTTVGTTTEKTTDEVVNNLLEITHNLGKALTCPICINSLREAQLLPCCHAFCKACLAKTFNPLLSSSSNNGNKKKKGSSPPPTAFKQCPTCKKPADRRSVVPIPQLDDQVRAYKQILRAFGLTTIERVEGIAMTQLDPEDNADELDVEGYLHCLQASRTVSGVIKRGKPKDAVDVAASSTTTTTQRPSELRTHNLRNPQSHPQQLQRLTKEQMESQNEIRRWQQVTKEQENVVKVNQDALNKLKGQAHQLVQRKMVQVETAKFLATVNEADASKADAAVDKTVNGTTSNGDNSDEEVDFCTAPDGESVEYDTAKESQGLSITNTSSPMVVNDGNTVLKSERSGEDRSSTIPGSRVLNLEVSPEAQKKKEEGRDSLGTRTASPIVLHDGNTVRKTRPGNKDENDNEEDKTSRSSGNFLRCEGVAMKRASDVDMEMDDDEESEYGAETQPLLKSAPLKSGSQDEDVSEYGAGTLPIIGKLAADREPVAASASSVNDPAQRNHIVKGSIVMVQARTWPGINKHGGVGRVTKVHSSTEIGGGAVQYDVSYVLGGKEKFVDESFVQLHKTSEEESSTTAASARKPRKSSENEMESRRPKRTQQKVTFKEEVRIYNEEELKHIPAEALEWAGIVPKKGKGKTKLPGKKRALADSNSNTNPAGSSTKKRKAAPSAAAPASKTASNPNNEAKHKKQNIVAEAESSAVEALIAMAHDSGTSSLNEIISPLSTQEIVQYADERYSSLLSTSGDSVLNVVTSNLSDAESDSLISLCKLLKDKNVSLKLMKSFKANKTHLCITSASIEKQPKPSNVVSNARTVKVMRSTLAGLPILSQQWVDACLSEGEIVAPTGDMSVRTLPRKQQHDNDDGCDVRFGVAKYAAAFQQGMQSNTLLSGVQVLMCGSFGGSSANDIKGLLQDAGATIISSVSAASRFLSDMSSSDVDTTFVFLCDDSLLDKSCGISDSLYKQAKKVRQDSQHAKVMAVHFSWLFDCISCATVIPATSYEPIAPRAKALWRLAAGAGTEEEDRGKKSQFY